MSFEIGDIVEAFGVQGVVVDVDRNNIFDTTAIKVDFETGERLFGLDGRYEQWHKEPTLKLIAKVKPTIKQKAEKVLKHIKADLNDYESCSAMERRLLESFLDCFDKEERGDLLAAREIIKEIKKTSLIRWANDGG